MLSTHATGSALLSLSLISAFFTHHGAATETLSAMTYVACFSSSTPLTEASTYTYQSSGHCQEVCVAKNQAVLGLTAGDDCWCGDLIPASADQVDDSYCNSPCTGYGQDDCGGDNYWSVYLTGTESEVANYGASSSSSSASDSATTTSSGTKATSAAGTTTAAPSVVTSVAPGTTVLVTLSPTSAATATSSSGAVTNNEHKSSTNVAGIAAGVVVGVVAVIAIVVGLVFFLRHRRKQAAAAYEKNSASDFLAGGKIPASSRPTGPDSRLDPEAMLQKRMSDGSIMDNQDYSRRILKVTNPEID